MRVQRPPYADMMPSVAVHGDRPLSAIQYVCVHTTGNRDSFTLKDLETFGHNDPRRDGWHYGVDVNGAVAQYASIESVVFGASHFNNPVVHIEQIATEDYSETEWMHHRYVQLVTTAWIVARVLTFCNLPVRAAGSEATGRTLTEPSGATQHRWAPLPNDHTDCGTGYPFERMMRSAVWMAQHGVPAWLANNAARETSKMVGWGR